MWRESSNETQPAQVDVTDVVFRIECAQLPLDHASALAAAICEHAPQLKQIAQAGIHPIHVAGSQNGWERPNEEGQSLLLSKRTRLRIRTQPDNTAELIQQLTGLTLDVDGYQLRIVAGHARALTPCSTLFSRYAYYQDLGTASDETNFVQRVLDQCTMIGFAATKVLCGREQYVRIHDDRILTRSVLLADIPTGDSLTLQAQGLGDGRTIGCGLLIPHKDTGAVNQSYDE